MLFKYFTENKHTQKKNNTVEVYILNFIANSLIIFLNNSNSIETNKYFLPILIFYVKFVFM